MKSNEGFLATVIIPTYQYSNFICGAIDSILNQSFPQNEIEIIVVDDGSTDGTSEKIEKYKDRIKYFYQQNSGKAWATKVGIDTAQGKYIFNLDADDLFLPDKIQKVISVFEKDNDIVHIGHPAIYWDTDEDVKRIESIPVDIKGHKVFGRDLLSYFYKRKMLFGGGSTFAGRADVLKRIPIKQRIDMYIDEYLVLSTLNQGYSLFIEEPLSVWRVHKKNYSFNYSDRTKLDRSLHNMEAVLSEVLKGDFDYELRVLYLLKTKAFRTSVKEMLNEKSFLDILDLWSYVFKNCFFLKKDFFTVVKTYSLLNRTVPTSLLRQLKQIKTKIGG